MEPITHASKITSASFDQIMLNRLSHEHAQSVDGYVTTRECNKILNEKISVGIQNFISG